jgi:hypothetical protein
VAIAEAKDNVEEPHIERYIKERRKGWMQIQEECLWEDREDSRKLCHKRERVDSDTRQHLLYQQVVFCKTKHVLNTNT